VIFTETVTCNNNSTGSFNWCRFTTGANSALTISSSNAINLFSSIINSSNNPSISGSGTGIFTYENIIFQNNSSISGSLTTETKSWQPYSRAIVSTDGTKVGTAAFNSAQFTVDTNGFVSLLSQAFNYTSVVGPTTYVVLSTDYYISCDSTAGAITLQFPNAPTFKRLWVVKDRTGNAAVNNISLTTPGGTVTFDGLTTYVMNSNFQAVNLLANTTPTYEVY
jgi:hypothetical protein